MLRTTLGPLQLKNPILSASGTFGSGWEGRAHAGLAAEDLAAAGALVSKTVTKAPRRGNPPPRILETPSGMLNSIGLENRGIDHFLAETLPRMKTLGPAVIVNIGGEAVREFAELAGRVCEAGAAAIELNLSCPNVQGGRLPFSTVPAETERAVAAVKRVSTLPVFAKLSPNVTDIAPIARAAEQGGADGITAVNTFVGMAIDWRSRRPVLGRGIGGLSGPAIRPLALRMVHDVCRAVRIPVIGVGGIATAEDVLQFLCAGASAVEVGTSVFADPRALARLVSELEDLLRAEGETVRGMIGSLRTEPLEAAWR
ncbi:MAG: dihydroorotate dehydrogenase [Planctomycetota bacterium]